MASLTICERRSLALISLRHLSFGNRSQLGTWRCHARRFHLSTFRKPLEAEGADQAPFGSGSANSIYEAASPFDTKRMRRKGFVHPIRRGAFVDVKTIAAALTANRFRSARLRISSALIIASNRWTSTVRRSTPSMLHTPSMTFR